MRPLLESSLGTAALPIRFLFWDGSSIGPGEAATTVRLHSPHALRRLMWAPNELGLGRAYVAGEIDIEGDVYGVFTLRDVLGSRDEHVEVKLGKRAQLEALRAARRLGVLGPPLRPPPEEARLRGRRHSRARDAAAIAHHYDVGNHFYRLVLGPTMTYSCGYWDEDGMDLNTAQEHKYDLIASKLGLEPGMRLLDVGCGWGGMVMHAVRHYGVEAAGITVSSAQAELAGERVAAAGLTDRAEIRLQDYRDIDDGPYDAISSIGMFEHVGLSQLGVYFEKLHGLLRPGGRLLNHGISRPPGGGAIDPKSFIGRYVFPDGELHEVGSVVSALQERGLEVRDVHSLREHYALTLRAWGANLEANWAEAVEQAGEARARVWRLYMAGCAVNFEQARTSIHQVLAVRPHPGGASDMPATRRPFLG